MESISLRQTGDSRFLIWGELNRPNIQLMVRYLRTLKFSKDSDMTLDLHALDIVDSASLAVLVCILREMRAHTRHLILEGAPQVLGHNLYRANLLSGEHAIELRDMREDEAYG